MKKTDRILELFRCFYEGARISRQEYIEQHDITSRTFERDIADIRAFLQEHAAYQCILFDSRSNTYTLHNTSALNVDGEEPLSLDMSDCFVLCEILLHHTLIPAGEREHLSQSLLFRLLKSEQEYLHKLIDRTGLSFSDFGDSPHPTMKLVSDLLRVIQYEKIITLHFNDQHTDECCVPYTLSLSESHGVLIAWGVDEEKPKLYRLSSIHSFDVGTQPFFRINTEALRTCAQEYEKQIANGKE